MSAEHYPRQVARDAQEVEADALGRIRWEVVRCKAVAVLEASPTLDSTHREAEACAPEKSGNKMAMSIATITKRFSSLPSQTISHK